MRKTITITYPASPVRTAQMLADPAYQEARVSRAGLDNASVDVAQRGQGFVATIAGSIQPSQLPSVASRFVRSAVAFSVAESWGEPKDDGSRSTMSPAGEATTVTVDVDLKVTVPLVGKTIEEKAMGMVGRVVADEERRAAAWLAEH